MLSTKIKLIAHFKIIRKEGETTMEDASKKFRCREPIGWVFGAIGWVFGVWVIMAIAAFFVSLIPGFYLGLGMSLNGRGTNGWLEYCRNDVVEPLKEQFQYYSRQYGWVVVLLGCFFFLPAIPGAGAGLFIGGYLGAALPPDIAIAILAFTAFIFFYAAAVKTTVWLFAATGYIGLGSTGVVITTIGIGLLIFL